MHTPDDIASDASDIAPAQPSPFVHNEAPQPSTVRIFALTTRGLEAVSAHELALFPGVAVESHAYRRVWARCTEVSSLLTARTVDDVFVWVQNWQHVGRTRAMLNMMRERSYTLDLREAAAVCAELRPIGTPPTFSVTASFVGKRNYSNDEIKQAIADGVENSHEWEYVSDDATADLNVRVFIEHELAMIGVRLAQTALHHRPYKLTHLHGSLKPPVAAALLWLLDAQPGQRLVDPCCGAGTVLIEAAQRGLSAHGGDTSAEAVDAAQHNIAAANVAASVTAWDARRLPLDDRSTDYVATNLPWGRQVAVDEELPALYEDVLGEVRRILVPGGRAAILTSRPELVAAPGLVVEQQIEISLFGQTPTIVLLGVQK